MFVPSMCLAVQVADDPAGDPALGLVDVTTFPAVSPATHSADDGHDTPYSELGASTGLAVQIADDPAGVPALGSVEVTTLPALSTATHSDPDG